MPSTSRSRGSAVGPNSSPRTPLIPPMSERQQMALVMQMTSQEQQPPTPPPAEERKRTRQQRNERGETPLHVAAIRGDHEQVKKLLDQGSEPDVADFAGWTALHEACSYGWYQVVEALVAGGADVNAKGLDDDTPLHDASTSGNLKMVKFLVDSGADPYVKNAKGKTPADYAAPHIYNYLHSLKGVKDGKKKRAKHSKKRDKKPRKTKRSRACGVKSRRKTTSTRCQLQEVSLDLAFSSESLPSPDKHYYDTRGRRAMQRRTSSHNKDTNARSSHVGRSRDDNKKGNASTSGEGKGHGMEGLAQAEHCDGKDASAGDKGATADTKDDCQTQMSNGLVSSSQEDATSIKRQLSEGEAAEAEGAEDDGTKRKKRKDNDDKEPMAKPAAVARGANGRVLTGNKLPGPASKTGATPLGKSGGGQGTSKTGGSSSKSSSQSQKTSSGGGSSGKLGQGLQGKSGGGKGSSAQSKGERKSPVASPKGSQLKDNSEGDDDTKAQESTAPKVPPLKIVIPGGAGGSGNRNEQEDGSGQRGSGKGRGNSSTLPYVIPCTTDTGVTSDSDGTCEEKRSGEGKAAQRVLRSHRTADGDKERTSPQSAGSSQGQVLSSNKSPPPSGSSQDDHAIASTSSSSRSESGQGASVELHPRKRKIKSSKDSHARELAKNAAESAIENSAHMHNVTHSNPYQMYIHIRKQIDKRQKSLFPVKPKPPKDFNKYLMNRCTYTLQGNVAADPNIEPPITLPMQMREEYMAQEKERHRLRVQHLVEKEKLVLAVEQEILRVHGRAERAVANQSLPFSVCTMLRDREVYNVLAPDQEEKRNAQRSRCNGRQINSWLQEVDDKWEKIKEGMLKRQHTEAETLHAVQCMGWEWKLKELGLADHNATLKIDPAHVPQVHVSNFDLPA